jgi:hypothetical protein
MKSFSLSLLLLVLAPLAAWGQNQSQTQVPPPDEPSVTVDSTGDQGDGSAHWDPDPNNDPDRNWANDTDNEFDYRWRLYLDPGSTGGYYDEGSGITYYGLFVQEVTTIASGSSCDGEFSFFNWFTYYEWAWVTDQSNFQDTFSTGNWNTSAGQSEKGFILKRGVAKFIPITQEGVDEWAENGTKPEAVETAEEFEENADGDWNTEAGDDGNIPVEDEFGDQEPAGPGDDNGANSGSWPNSDMEPEGWADDFNGKAQTITRTLFVIWDYCQDDGDKIEDKLPMEK